MYAIHSTHYVRHTQYTLCTLYTVHIMCAIHSTHYVHSTTLHTITMYKLNYVVCIVHTSNHFWNPYLAKYLAEYRIYRQISGKISHRIWFVDKSPANITSVYIQMESTVAPLLSSVEDAMEAIFLTAHKEDFGQQEEVIILLTMTYCRKLYYVSVFNGFP